MSYTVRDISSAVIGVIRVGSIKEISAILVPMRGDKKPHNSTVFAM
jgi:hypothetical protein